MVQRHGMTKKPVTSARALTCSDKCLGLHRFDRHKFRIVRCVVYGNATKNLMSWRYKGRGIGFAKRWRMNRGDLDDQRGVAEDLLVQYGLKTDQQANLHDMHESNDQLSLDGRTLLLRRYQCPPRSLLYSGFLDRF